MKLQLQIRGKPLLWSRGRGKGAVAAHAYLEGWRSAYCGTPISLEIPFSRSLLCSNCLKCLRHWDQEIKPQRGTRRGTR